jgi:hypothetical protein
MGASSSGARGRRAEAQASDADLQVLRSWTPTPGDEAAAYEAALAIALSAQHHNTAAPANASAAASHAGSPPGSPQAQARVAAPAVTFDTIAGMLAMPPGASRPSSAFSEEQLARLTGLVAKADGASGVPPAPVTAKDFFRVLRVIQCGTLPQDDASKLLLKSFADSALMPLDVPLPLQRLPRRAGQPLAPPPVGDADVAHSPSNSLAPSIRLTFLPRSRMLSLVGAFLGAKGGADAPALASATRTARATFDSLRSFVSRELSGSGADVYSSHKIAQVKRFVDKVLESYPERVDAAATAAAAASLLAARAPHEAVTVVPSPLAASGTVDAGLFVTMGNIAALAAAGYPVLEVAADMSACTWLSVTTTELAEALEKGLPLNASLLRATANADRAVSEKLEAPPLAHAVIVDGVVTDVGAPAGGHTGSGNTLPSDESGLSSWHWRIDSAQMRFYDSVFDDLRAQAGGVLSMHVAPRSWLHFSVADLGVPFGVAAQIWRLADLDLDNRLDDAEFSIAMHMLCAWMRGVTVPPYLHADMIPPSKQVLSLRLERGVRRVRSVFISYRWDTPDAKMLAVWLQKELFALHYDAVFLDIKNLSSGSAGADQFAEQIKSAVAAHDAFVPLWTVGCYDRCVNSWDIVRLEVRTALQLKKIICPFFTKDFWIKQKGRKIAPAGLDEPEGGFTDDQRTEPFKMPEDIRDVFSIIGTMYIHEFPEAGLRKLHRNLQGWV